MTRFAPLFLALTLICSMAADSARAAGEPASLDSLQDAHHTREEFVQGMASMTLAILQDSKKNFADRKVVLRQAFKSVVDIDWIAKFVLGHTWNKASDEQRAKYTELYKTFLTESYVSNFAEDPEKRIKDIKILGLQDAEDSSFVVNTNVMLANMEEFRVDYRVSDHKGKYRVIDIVIENVSLLSTHRAQFMELVANHGIDGLIGKLEAMNNRHVDPINVSMKQ